MLAQQGFGLPNLAALSGGMATSTISLVKFDNVSTFGTHVVTIQVPGQILPVLFQSQTVIFNPVIVMVANLPILPQRFDNQSVFPAHLFTWDQGLRPDRFTNESKFFLHVVETFSPEPKYDYPIGHDLDSDYGMKRAMTFYKQTLVIGRR